MALSANDETIVEKDHPMASRQDLPVAAGVEFFQGAIVVISAGYAQPATTATTAKQANQRYGMWGRKAFIDS